MRDWWSVTWFRVRWWLTHSYIKCNRLASHSRCLPRLRRNRSWRQSRAAGVRLQLLPLCLCRHALWSRSASEFQRALDSRKRSLLRSQFGPLARSIAARSVTRGCRAVVSEGSDTNCHSRSRRRTHHPSRSSCASLRLANTHSITLAFSAWCSLRMPDAFGALN
jgi:hypothetical protein